MEYKVKIELLSETILGSGEAVAGYIDLEVLYDELGLPFLKGKTLKGRLREEAENIVRLQKDIFTEEEVDRLFGKSGNKEDTILALTDCTASENIKKVIKNAKLTQGEILDSLTDIRSFTSIDDDGVAKEGSLRQIRVINKGLKLFSEVSFRGELTKNEENLFGLSVLALKHIGLMSNRGKGKVNCTLLRDDKNITEELINNFRKKVR